MIKSNLEKIKKILYFNKGLIFYKIMIIQRKKDDPYNENKLIKTYYITSIYELESLIPKIIDYVEKYKARAYINVQASDVEKLNKLLIKELAIENFNGNFNMPWKLVDKYSMDLSLRNKIIQKIPWCIFDIDTKDNFLIKELIENIKTYTKIIDCIITPNGYHLITEIFNTCPYLGKINLFKIKDKENLKENIKFKQIPLTLLFYYEKD